MLARRKRLAYRMQQPGGGPILQVLIQGVAQLLAQGRTALAGDDGQAVVMRLVAR
jgi:hypothetical protein